MWDISYLNKIWILFYISLKFRNNFRNFCIKRFLLLEILNVNITYIYFSGKDISIHTIRSKISYGNLSTGKSVRPGMEMVECNGTRYAWRLSTAKYHAEFHVSLSSKLQSSSCMRGPVSRVKVDARKRRRSLFLLLLFCVM